MVNYEQVRKGIVNYINYDLAPIAPKAIGIGMAAFGPTIVDAKLKKLFYNGLLEGTPFVDGEMIDVDSVVSLLKPAANGKWPIELFGIKFTESDLDKIYRYIKEV